MKQLCLIACCLFGLHGALLAQESTAEAEFLRQENLLMEKYTHRQAELQACLKIQPAKLDSLQARMHEEVRELIRQTVALATRYASTRSGLERLFATRQHIPKDTLARILHSVSPEMQASFHGQRLKAYVETRQIREGDTLSPFPCTQSDGRAFDWNTIRGKQVLLIYGGLECMGAEGREALKRLQAQTSEQDFLLLIYCPCTSLETLKQWEEQYPFDAVLHFRFQGR